MSECYTSCIRKMNTRLQKRSSCRYTIARHISERDRMKAAELLWGLLFGSIGVGYFMYGRRQGKMIPLLCGVVLIVYPYFMPNTTVLVIIGAIFTAVPYFIRR